jgi:hypothetical protein
MEQPFFYFTIADPDYRVKGARDPLGLQVIWQRQARELIPHLSTVCRSLRDFQILSLAYYFYGKPANKYFVDFFLRFEQWMAYTRHAMDPEEKFGGINRVRRYYTDRTRIQISTQSKDQILSDQRSYGIWAKYNRPYNDIGILKDPDFENIYHEKTSYLQYDAAAQKILNKLITQPHLAVDKEATKLFEDLLAATPAEERFYRQKLLKVNGPNPYQNQLYAFFQEYGTPDYIELYPFLESLANSEHGRVEGLPKILSEIQFTEMLLAPLDRIFRYLLTKPVWSRDEINHDAYLQRCRPAKFHLFDSTSGENKTKNEIAQALRWENWELVGFLAARNKTVTGWRGGAPWMSINNDLVEVHQNDLGMLDVEFDPAVHVENWYFIDTYFTLYKQLHQV